MSTRPLPFFWVVDGSGSKHTISTRGIGGGHD